MTKKAIIVTADPKNKWAHDAKKYAGYAKQAADKFDGWVQAAKKAEAAGADLDDIKALLTAVKYTSEISTALGVVGFGLSIVAALLPIPSTESLILKSVTRIEGELSDLSKKVSQIEKELQGTIWKATSQTALENDHIIHIKTVAGYLNSIAQKKAKKEDYSADEASLRTYNLHTLKDAVNEIQGYLNGTNPANLLSLTYDQTYGDPVRVLQLGGYYLHMINLAVSSEAAAKALIKSHSVGRALTDEETAKIAQETAGDPTIATDYAAQIANVSALVQKWVHKCLDDKQRIQNVNLFLSAKVLSEAFLTVPDYQGGATRLVTALSGQFPWMDFSTIIYAAQDDATAAGGVTLGAPDSRVITIDQTDLNKKKYTIQLYLSLRTTKGVKKIKSLDDMANAFTGTKAAEMATLAVLMNDHKRFGITRWHGHHVAVSVENFLITYYGAFFYPEHRMNWNGDYVWAGWTDLSTTKSTGSGDAPPADPKLGRFMGVAAQHAGTVHETIVRSSDFNSYSGVETRKADSDWYQIVVFQDDRSG